MTLFQDDDGKAYLISASEDNLTTHISLLTDDYLGTAGKFSRAFVNRNMEAPTVFKAHGNYYMICSGQSGWNPNAARSAVASTMLGPWTELTNPCLGTKEEENTTFKSQSTYVLPVAGKPNAFIFMADRWNPSNAIDGRYVWLPIEFVGDIPTLKWQASWKLDEFESALK
jgi:beta-xylosidase